MQMSRHGCIPMELYLQKQMAGYSLPMLALGISHKQDIEQKKSDAKGYMLYNFTYIKFKKQAME